MVDHLRRVVTAVIPRSSRWAMHHNNLHHENRVVVTGVWVPVSPHSAAAVSLKKDAKPAPIVQTAPKDVAKLNILVRWRGNARIWELKDCTLRQVCDAHTDK